MSQPRQRLNSMSDHSSPSSEASDNSETFDVCDLRLENINLETSLGTEVTEVERQQIESFLSGLGTEVSRWLPLITCLDHFYDCRRCHKRQLQCTLTSSRVETSWSKFLSPHRRDSIGRVFCCCCCNELQDYMMTMLRLFNER